MSNSNRLSVFSVFSLCAGKSYYPGLDEHISEEAGGIGGVGVGFGDGPTISMGSPARSSPQSQGSEVTERFSRKVFVGGLPPDIDEGKCAIYKTCTSGLVGVFFLCAFVCAFHLRLHTRDN